MTTEKDEKFEEPKPTICSGCGFPIPKGEYVRQTGIGEYCLACEEKT